MVFLANLFQCSQARGGRLRLPEFQVERSIHLLDFPFVHKNFLLHIIEYCITPRTHRLKCVGKFERMVSVQALRWSRYAPAGLLDHPKIDLAYSP